MVLSDESCFKLSISTYRCLICLFNPPSLPLVWFVKELGRDGGGFPLLFLMFSAFNCSNVVLCWVFVDNFVLLDFWLSFYVGFASFPCQYVRIQRFSCPRTSSYWTLVWLLLLGLYFQLSYFFNFHCCKTFLVESSFAFFSV